MGDIVEMTTSYIVEKSYFKLSTSNSMWFAVKATSNAAIILTETANQILEFLIVLGDQNNQSSFIRHSQDPEIRISTPNILCGDNFKKFLLSWNDGFLSLYTEFNNKPLLQSGLGKAKLGYFCLTVAPNRFGPYEPQIVQWKFELPCEISRPKLKPMERGTLHWVPMTDKVPPYPLIGGHENGILYIIRAEHEGSLTPGKYNPYHNIAQIAWGGEAHDKSPMEILCGYDCTWEKVFRNKIPPNAVCGGYSEHRREPLFVGRSHYNGHIIPGKIHSTHRTCYIPYNGKEVGVQDYEILLAPSFAIQDRSVVNASQISISDDNDIASDGE